MKSVDALRKWADGLSGVWIDPNDHTITITTGWDAPPDMDSVSLRDHVNGILDGIEREVKELTDIEHLQPHAAQTIAECAAKLRLAEGSE